MEGNIFFDARWIGDHGIGRVGRVLDARLRLPHLKATGKPSSAFDPFRLMWSMMRLPKNSAVFCPGYNAPLFFVRPYIFIIHDLNHIDRKENSSLLKRFYYKTILRRACYKSFKVLTVSEFSRRRILEWVNIAEDHVVNIGNGVDEKFNIEVTPYKPGYPYLLCVSNRKGHKNEKRVIEAFSQANISPDVRLMFTGNPTTHLLSLCSKLKVEHRVVFEGHVSENALPGVYRGALALVFPSLYEGFGLPVVEAMACGTPVVTSNTTSLPEVAGDAALLVNPSSVLEITHSIEAVVNDSSLRTELVAKGAKRVEMLKWEKVEEKVRQVINQLQTKLQVTTKC